MDTTKLKDIKETEKSTEELIEDLVEDTVEELIEDTVEDTIETKTDNKIDNLINLINFDNIETESKDYLLYYYFNKYGLSYMYYCFDNRDKLKEDNNLLLLISRYIKIFLFNNSYILEDNFYNLCNYLSKNKELLKMDKKREINNKINKNIKYDNKNRLKFLLYLKSILINNDNESRKITNDIFYNKLLNKILLLKNITNTRNVLYLFEILFLDNNFI